MKKKLIITAVLCVVVLAAVLGGFAIASADDEDTANVTASPRTDLLEKVAEIYEQNTGTAINPVELEKAFQEAHTAMQSARLDQVLQALVEKGKITQEEADQWKAWWNSRPDNALTDEFKSWLEARPDIPAFFGGMQGTMPFGRMHRAFADDGKTFGFGFRHCLPDTTE